jgi:hypothetical protein
MKQFNLGMEDVLLSYLNRSPKPITIPVSAYDGLSTQVSTRNNIFHIIFFSN